MDIFYIMFERWFYYFFDGNGDCFDGKGELVDGIVIVWILLLDVLVDRMLIGWGIIMNIYWEFFYLLSYGDLFELLCFNVWEENLILFFVY